MQQTEKAHIQFDIAKFTDMDDFKYLVNDIGEVINSSDPETMNTALERISRILKRLFCIDTDISIIDQESAPFFGVSVYPDFTGIQKIVEEIMTNQSSDVIDTWSSTTNWVIELDSKLMFNKTNSFSREEIAILLFYRIEQTLFNYNLPEKITEIIRVSLTSLDYRNNAIVRSKVCRFLYMIPFMIACGYVNYPQQPDEESMITKGTGTAMAIYSSAWKRILTNYGMTNLLDRDSKELDGTIQYVLNWIYESVNDMKYSTRTLRHNLQKYISAVGSNYIGFILKKIFVKFTTVSNKIAALENVNCNPNTPKAVALHEKMIDEHWANVYKYISEAKDINDEFIDKNGMVRKVDDREIDIIRIRIDNIESTDDKIYLIERIYKFASIVDYSLELLSDPAMSHRVRMSKSALLRQKSELDNLRKLVVSVRIPDKRYGVFIKYPVGYKG